MFTVYDQAYIAHLNYLFIYFYKKFCTEGWCVSSLVARELRVKTFSF